MNTPLTDLKEEIDPPLTHLSLVALSSPITPKDTIIGVLTLLASALPLSYCIGLEIGERFRGGTNFVEDYSLVRSKDLTSIEPCVEEGTFEELLVTE